VGAPVNRGGSLRACGKPYETEADARSSKRASAGTAEVVPCSLGHFHLRSVKVKAAPARKAVRDTGPDALTRAVIYNRDGNCCAACGKAVPAGSWRSIQHRVARAHGGTNETSNLVLLCGSATSPGCHRVCEDRKKHMQAQGFYLESWQDPRAEPIMLHGEDGGVTVWLTDDGEYSLENPLAVAS
jgi:hypothetical protein